MASPATPPVSVPGLGLLPHRFSQPFNNISISPGDTANGHNENRTNVTCEDPLGLNDTVTFSGWTTTDGYELDVLFQSAEADVEVGILKYGRVVLDYNQTTRRWSMKGYVRDDTPGAKERREWAFCDSQAMVDHVVLAMMCFGASDKGKSFRGTMALLAGSLEHNKSDIVQIASRYAQRNDCTAIPPSAHDLCSSAWCAPGGMAD